jgi:MoaA/NifB/PqqE/SkfB family radical SAM enzyme
MNVANKLKQSTLLGYSLLARKVGFAEIPIFATDRCNSQCVICKIWKKKPKTDLDPEVVRRLLSSKVLTRSSRFILTGGEFILHPKHEEILSLLNQSGKSYLLLSNGVLPDKLIRVVREFGVKHVSLSLDGSPETYERIRGVDGYSSVERVVEELKDDDVHVNMGYTVCPWNSRSDLLHVMDFCKKHAVSLSVGYYCSVEYYDVGECGGPLYFVGDLIDDPYHKLYPLWATGHLNMPCLGIFLKPVIRPNGDVCICEPQEIKLGNLYEQDMGQIWHSQRTRFLQKKYFSCNGCWHDAQRPCDISAITAFKSLVPSLVLNRAFGKSDWKRIYQFLK